MKTNILHIIPEISSGGAVRSMVAISKYSSEMGPFAHVFVSLIKANTDVVAEIIAKGFPVVSEPNNEELFQLIRDTDIVELHYWNHPRMGEILALNWPLARVMCFYHVVGNSEPHCITEELVEFSDVNIPCNPVSRFELDVFKKCDEFNTQSKVEMVYDAGDLEPLYGLPRKSHSGKFVGYIGTVDFVKMHRNHAGLCARIKHPDCNFLICGDGGARMTLQAEAEKYRIENRYHLLGYQKDIHPVLEVLDVYGYPLCEETYAAAELNLQEVMAVGIPPVVFPYGGIKGLVIDGFTGIVAHTENQYVQAIEFLLENGQEATRLGMNAKNYAKQIFGAENAATKINPIYQNLLKIEKRQRKPIITLPNSPVNRFLALVGPRKNDFENAIWSNNSKHNSGGSPLTHSTWLSLQSGPAAYSMAYPNIPEFHYWKGIMERGQGLHSAAAESFLRAQELGFPKKMILERMRELAVDQNRVDLIQKCDALIASVA